MNRLLVSAQAVCLWVLLAGASSTMGLASEPTEKIAEWLAVSPISLLNDGRILFIISRTGDLMVYEPNTHSSAVLGARVSNMGASGRGTLDVSADGKRLVLLESSAQVQFRVFDLNQSGYPSFVIPESRGISQSAWISSDGDAYAFPGFSGNFSSENLWVFNLGEYLWDLQAGNPQPTGFYSDTVPLGTTRNSQLRISSLAWSPDASELAVFATGWEGNNPVHTYLVYDRTTRKTRSLGTHRQSLARMFWPTPQYLYWVGFPPGGGAGLHRLDLQTQVSETLFSENVDANSVQFSADGRWISFNGGISDPSKSTAGLFDLQQRQLVRLKGVSNVRLSADGKTILFQRPGVSASSQEAPFWVASFAEIVGARQNGSVDIAGLKTKLATAGQFVPSFEMPTDKERFEKQFAFQNLRVNSNGQFIALSGRLVNLSSQFYSLQLPRFEPARCQVFDDKGKLLGESPPPFQPDRYNNLVGPKEGLEVFCNVFFASVPTRGSKGKVALQLVGAPDFARVEREITF